MLEENSTTRDSVASFWLHLVPPILRIQILLQLVFLMRHGHVHSVEGQTLELMIDKLIWKCLIVVIEMRKEALLPAHSFHVTADLLEHGDFGRHRLVCDDILAAT